MFLFWAKVSRRKRRIFSKKNQKGTTAKSILRCSRTCDSFLWPTSFIGLFSQECFFCWRAFTYAWIWIQFFFCRKIWTIVERSELSVFPNNLIWEKVCCQPAYLFQPAPLSNTANHLRRCELLAIVCCGIDIFVWTFIHPSSPSHHLQIPSRFQYFFCFIKHTGCTRLDQKKPIAAKHIWRCWLSWKVHFVLRSRISINMPFRQPEVMFNNVDRWS